MTSRYEAERDFGLKVALRKILWAQGYSARVNVLLGYDVDPRGKSRAGRAGLTDLDVLGLRLDGGFKLETVVAECKSGSEKVAENLFWLSGVSQFFGSNAAVLVRGADIPEHAPILARALGISLVNQDDLQILSNIYLPPGGMYSSSSWDAFFSASTVGRGLEVLGRLPDSLRSIKVYRETNFWMQPAYLRLTRAIASLRPLARDGLQGHIAESVFADFVWLYVVAIWDACVWIAMNGLSRLESGLKIYLSGDEAGMDNARRLNAFVNRVLRQPQSESIELPILPPYFDRLVDLITRCIRRPRALMKMAQRAEWLLYGQLIEQIGVPPWPYGEEDVLCDKLLGDVAIFLGNSSEVDATLVDNYLWFLSVKKPSESAIVESPVPYVVETESSDQTAKKNDNTLDAPDEPVEGESPLADNPPVEAVNGREQQAEGKPQGNAE